MFFSKDKKLSALFSFLLISFLITGCGVYRNFTTYFNTYYNAKTLFDRTEEEILKKKKDVFAFRDDLQSGSRLFGGTQGTNTSTQQYGASGQSQYNQSQYNQSGQSIGSTNQYGTQSSSKFSTGSLASGNTNQDLTKVIEKCSKILQYEKESSYFPAALFMTGKALYYQQEYSKAQRKFTELAGLGETDYTYENKLWLAKTHLQLRNFDEGLKLIEEVKKYSVEEGDEDLLIDASITKISFLIFREQYNQAASECQDFIKNSNDDEMKALVANQLGIIYKELGENKNALDAFASVIEYEPTFEVELQSKLQHARLLKILNRVDESENELTKMENQGKFKNNLDEIYIELAIIYSDKGDGEKAVDLLKIVDSTYKQLPTSGIASLELGRVYENHIRDYDSAYKYYNKASSSLAPHDEKVIASEKTKSFEKYFSLKKEFNELNSQYIYILNPKRFIQDSIDYAIAYKDYEAENKEYLESQQTTSSFTSDNSQEVVRKQQLQQKQLELIKQKKIAYEKSKKNINETFPVKDLILLNLITKPERPKADSASITTSIASNYFMQGSNFFAEMDKPDSATVYFTNVLKNFSDKPVVPQTLFTLGTLYETQKDSIAADSLYKKIVDKYPTDKMYEPAAIKLGLIKKDFAKSETSKKDPEAKSYLLAENLYYNKKYDEAIDSFKVISKKYAKSRYAAKSLTMVGMIYEDNLKNYDSAAVAYSLLSKNFSLEPLARRGIQKYDEYKKEKDRIKQEEEAKKKEEEIKRKEAEAKEKAEKENQETVKKDIAKTVETKTDSTQKVADDTPRKKQSYLERLKADSDTTKRKIQIKEIGDGKESEVVEKKNEIPDSSKVKKEVKLDIKEEVKEKEPIDNKQQPDTTKNKKPLPN